MIFFQRDQWDRSRIFLLQVVAKQVNTLALYLHHQRAILNFTPGPQGWTLPLGVNFAPGVKFVPQGNVHPFVHP
jgi:hypothetical protein